jgi:hypothetical protein
MTYTNATIFKSDLKIVAFPVVGQCYGDVIYAGEQRALTEGVAYRNFRETARIIGEFSA